MLVAVNKCESEKNGALSATDFWQLGLGEPYPVSALHGVGTAELLETMFESIVEKRSAIDGFGTKVKKLTEAKEIMNHKGPLPWEDETDYKMRKYNIGDAAKKVTEDYEAALAAFDDEDRPEEINIAIVGRPNVALEKYELCRGCPCGACRMPETSRAPKQAKAGGWGNKSYRLPPT